MRLLTRWEYDNTVFDLLGDDTRPSRSFPPEPNVGGFDNDSVSHQVNPLLVEQLTLTAHELASRAVTQGRISALAPCEAVPYDECAQSFIARFGKRAFRRPLSEPEQQSFLRLFRKGTPTLGYASAIGLVIEAMLQSPQFLYRVEAPLHPHVGAEQRGSVALNSYEIAARLSYFLWGSMPDDELLAAADRDELKSPHGLEVHARRLLEDPRARAQVTKFHQHWLGLSRFGTVVRNTGEPSLNDSWRRSLLAFVDDVFWSETGTVRDLFTSPIVYLDEPLGQLYGVTAGPGLEPVQLDPSRSGLLTQPGLMAMLAHPNQSSPIQRGVFVREHILCHTVPAPPPTVDDSPPDPDPSATTRERFAVHTEDPTCSACHQLIDPVGFGFEHFDELGRYRSEENGMRIDASGEIFMSPDPNLDGPFEGAAELSARLAESPQVLQCLARYWHRFAMGRPDTPSDACTIQEAAEAPATAAGFKELLVSLVRSESFRHREPWPEEQP